MKEIFNQVKSEFDQHMSSIRQLMNFDRTVLDFCIFQIEALDERIRNNQILQISNPLLLPTNTLTSLKNIRQNDSMRNQYIGVYGQCVVLTVSYYTNALSNLFKKAISFTASNHPEFLNSSNQELKFSFSELAACKFQIAESLGDFLIKKKDLSFQDMQSISRSFLTFFNIEITKDRHTNNIIIAQASRHAIVHTLSIASEKFMNQIKEAQPRDILKEIRMNSQINIKPEEIDIIIYSMEIQLSSIINQLDNKIN